MSRNKAPMPGLYPVIGDDHELKRDLDAAGRIMTCFVALTRARLHEVPYPCDAHNRPISLLAIERYSDAHSSFLDGVFCFCEVVYGIQREVRIFTPAFGVNKGDPCIGCRAWVPKAKANDGGQRGCRYFINIRTDLDIWRNPGGAQGRLKAYPKDDIEPKREARHPRAYPRLSKRPSAVSSSQETAMSSSPSRSGQASSSTLATQASREGSSDSWAAYIIPGDPEERKALRKRKISLNTAQPVRARKRGRVDHANAIELTDSDDEKVAAGSSAAARASSSAGGSSSRAGGSSSHASTTTSAPSGGVRGGESKGKGKAPDVIHVLDSDEE